MTRAIVLSFAEAMKYAKKVEVTFSPMAGRHGAVRELISRLGSDKVSAANSKLEVKVNIVHDGESPKIDVHYVNNSQKSIQVWATDAGSKDMNIDQLMREMSKTPQIVFVKERLGMKLDDDGK